VKGFNGQNYYCLSINLCIFFISKFTTRFVEVKPQCHYVTHCVQNTLKIQSLRRQTHNPFVLSRISYICLTTKNINKRNLVALFKQLTLYIFCFFICSFVQFSIIVKIIVYQKVQFYESNFYRCPTEFDSFTSIYKETM